MLCFNILIVFTLAYSTIPIASGLSTVPLFIIDFDHTLSHLSIAPNPFLKVSKQGLSFIIRDAIERCGTIILFIEEKFSIEDVSVKDAIGSPYFHLHQGLLDNKVKFMPAVTQPYTSLNELLPRRQVNEFYMNSKATNLQLFDKKYTHYYVFFEDFLNVTRAEALRLHDLIIREVYFVVRQLLPGPVVAFYTGVTNPVEVETIKRMTPLAFSFENPVTFVDDNKWSRIKLGGMYFVKRNGSRQKVMKVKTRSHLDGSAMFSKVINVVIMHSDFNFTFRFHYNDKKWTLMRVYQNKFNESSADHVETMHVSAAWGESYECMSVPMVIRNNNIKSYKSFTISQYQIQLQQQSFSSFGPAVSCPSDAARALSLRADEPRAAAVPVPDTVYPPPKYFSTAIVASLFVSFILLGMLFVSIVVMMEVCNNDKFDDPHGKQLMFTEG